MFVYFRTIFLYNVSKLFTIVSLFSEAYIKMHCCHVLDNHELMNC
jgi:hypothetical protein